jgi:hypothetical protein
LTERSVVDPGVNAGGCFHLLNFIAYSYALQDTGTVRFHIDSNQSSSCDDPPTDLVWKKPYALKDDSVVVLAYGESDAAISTCDDPPK